MTAESCELFHCRNERSCVITTLSCLIPLAGFEVSLIGRFSGVSRGSKTEIPSIFWINSAELFSSSVCNRNRRLAGDHPSKYEIHVGYGLSLGGSYSTKCVTARLYLHLHRQSIDYI